MTYEDTLLTDAQKQVLHQHRLETINTLYAHRDECHLKVDNLVMRFERYQAISTAIGFTSIIVLILAVVLK